MAASAASSLNPQAPEYVPLSTVTGANTCTSSTEMNVAMVCHPPPSLPSSFLPAAAFPTSAPQAAFQFPYPTPTVYVPDHHHHPVILTTINIQREWKFLSPTTFVIPPPAPPPSPVALSDQPAAQSVLVPRVLIREKNAAPKRQVVRGRVKGSGFGFGRRGGGSMHELRKGDKDWKLPETILALKEGDDFTTVMIKNIPNQLTPRMLVEFMDKHCLSENHKNLLGICDEAESKPPVLSAYDFLYLPMDFQRRMNKGYAFVNFTEPGAAWKFFRKYDGKKWESSVSPKTKQIVRAKIQGKEALVTHFQKSCFHCHTDEYLPRCFSPARDGSGASRNELHHTTLIGIRRAKPRCHGR